MRRWRQTVLGLATAALWVCACGKSQETEDAKARAARPTIAPEDTANVPKAAPGPETTAPPVTDTRASGPATPKGVAVPDAAPGAESLRTAAPLRSSAPQAPPQVSASTAPPAAPAPLPGSDRADVVDVGGEVRVTPTKSDLTRVGPEKCQVCHRVQFTSWAETAHAKRTPPLDCEACHGPGSEYRTLAIMKDPAKARSAGLVIPGKEFCVTCHRGAWSDDLLRKAHAHKPVSP